MRRPFLTSGRLPALTTLLATAAACLLIFASSWSEAQTQTTAQPANEQVIVPEVDRRDVKVPKFPSNNFEMGLFVGTYATQNFGSHVLSGLRFGYHITEDFFAQAVYGRTKADDGVYRRLIGTGGGVFDTEKVNVSYYNLSFGYNVMPGEVFFGKNTAKATAIYLIGGVGSTKFDKQRRQTFNVGWGARLMLADWAALQVDMRDHIFSLDLLGKRENTQNIEMSAGLSFYF
jgi:outer membrane beta-barrel protein